MLSSSNILLHSKFINFIFKNIHFPQFSSTRKKTLPSPKVETQKSYFNFIGTRLFFNSNSSIMIYFSFWENHIIAPFFILLFRSFASKGIEMVLIFFKTFSGFKFQPLFQISKPISFCVTTELFELVKIWWNVFFVSFAAAFSVKSKFMKLFSSFSSQVTHAMKSFLKIKKKSTTILLRLHTQLQLQLALSINLLF